MLQKIKYIHQVKHMKTCKIDPFSTNISVRMYTLTSTLQSNLPLNLTSICSSFDVYYTVMGQYNLYF